MQTECYVGVVIRTGYAAWPAWNIINKSATTTSNDYVIYILIIPRVLIILILFSTVFF